MRLGLTLQLLAIMTAPVSAQPSDAPRKVVVQVWSNGLVPPNVDLTRGLALEVTHRLQMSPHLIVRDAVGGSDADVQYVVRLALRTSGEQRLRWDLQRRADAATLATDTKLFDTTSLAHQPDEIATAVLRKLGLPLLSRDSLAATTDAAAYADFLQILGQADATYEARIAALERVLPRLGEYVPAITALGSGYVDRAGIVKQPAPLYHRAAAALERALTLESHYPPARAKLASLYAKIGKSERAVELLREA